MSLWGECEMCLIGLDTWSPGDDFIWRIVKTLGGGRLEEVGCALGLIGGPQGLSSFCFLFYLIVMRRGGQAACTLCCYGTTCDYASSPP